MPHRPREVVGEGTGRRDLWFHNAYLCRYTGSNANRRSKAYFRSIAAAIACGLPAVLSWHQWWYGGGFGARVLVEALSVLALPLAWLLQRLQRASIIGRSLLMLIILFRIRLDLHQQDRYAKGILHYDPMTREQYWEIFVKLEKRIA